ncbi:replication terminator protein [Culicoidibacter larvae]|uniref:Replication terminator protein n=1 Tax=Culicoidibacter larvae TaxID=2579976 RepID=A0A5R8Q8E0_9FIRM|nr:replication terminator protein [Culicoidibacter larvae]TLG71400.1 replication terminator protein [Culicoidibacter larvae]
MDKNKNMAFDGLAGGAAGEQFQEVLQNIADPNTDPKKKRELQIKLIFEPDENRDLLNVNIQCVPKLAPSVQSFTRMSIGRDKTTGQMIAVEYDAQKSAQDAVDKMLEAPTTQNVFK